MWPGSPAPTAGGDSGYGEENHGTKNRDGEAREVEANAEASTRRELNYDAADEGAHDADDDVEAAALLPAGYQARDPACQRTEDNPRKKAYLTLPGSQKYLYDATGGVPPTERESARIVYHTRDCVSHGTTGGTAGAVDVAGAPARQAPEAPSMWAAHQSLPGPPRCFGYRA